MLSLILNGLFANNHSIFLTGQSRFSEIAANQFALLQMSD
jgi:hypothetical protein